MFTFTNEYIKIKNKLIELGVINNNANFACYSDNIFTYSYKKNELHIEFNIICNDDFLDVLPINELLEQRNIVYFDMGIYINDEKLDEDYLFNTKD